MAESRAGDLVNGRYRLDEVIGTGGMGRVWRARDEMLDREVAVKEVLLPPGLVGEQREHVNRRSVREARSAARLSHPGIITVHDIVVHEDAPMIVMEYVPGPSLAEAVENGGRMSVARVVEIGLAMARAVKEAHASGVVHRDLKPQNVLLAGNRVVITDFGIARLVGDATLTRSGAIMGTPAYMAPEQAHSPVATPEGDIWSLGATLYSAVEGRPPFPGNNYIEVLTALITSEALPPVHAGPLGDVLTRVLVKDPDLRPPMDELIELLQAVPVNDSSAAPSPAGAFPMPSESIAPGLVQPGLFQPSPRPDSTPEPGFGPPDPRFGTPQPLQQHPSFPEGGSPPIPFSRDAHGSPPLPFAHPDQRTPLPFQDGQGPPPISIPPLAPPTSTPPPILTSHDSLPPARTSYDSLSPQRPAGKGWKRRDLLVWAGLAAVAAAAPAAYNLSRDPEKKYVSGPAPVVPYLSGLDGGVRAVAFGPDGKLFVTASDGEGLVWWDAEKNTRLGTSKGPGQITGLAVSPDGARLAVSGTDKSVWLFDTATRQKTYVLAKHSSAVRSVAFSLDGALLASGGADDTIWLWDPATGKDVAPLKGHTDDVAAVVFHPDRKTLLSASSDRSVRLWDVAARKEDFAFREHRAAVLTVAASPDGKTLASGGDDQTVRLWDFEGRRSLGAHDDHSDVVKAVAFAPDGKTLASAGYDDVTRLWDFKSGKVTRELRDQNDYVLSLAYSRTGRLATGSADGTVRFY